MERRRFLCSLAAAGACAALAAPARAAAPVVIRAAASMDDDATPFVYAMQSGLFRRYGIDAQLQRATSGAAVAAGVVGGAFEVGKSSVTSLNAAHARGVPLVAIAPAGEYDASLPQQLAMIVRVDAPIKTGADLNGKTIGVSAINDFFSLASRAWTDAHGGDSSTLKLVEIPMSGVAAAVAAGRIDAGIVVQPYFQLAVADPKLRLLGDPSSALGTHFMQSTWFTSTDYAAKNPAVIDRFMRAMREASIYVNAHHAETADVLTKFMKLETPPMTTRIPLGVRFDPAPWQSLIDIQARYKMIPATFDVHDLIYPPALH